MRLKLLILSVSLAWLGANSASAQVVSLNPSPTRVIGTPAIFDPIRPAPLNGNPNLVEGRELDTPAAVAVDLNASPYPIVYVSDFGNNRVLAWQYSPGLGDPNSGSFPPADLVIGQPDLYTTFRSGPAAGNAIGLTSPSGLAVDANGNLYVVDSGNNRILRFPRRDPSASQTPDLVLGQATFNANVANLSGISAKTIALNGTPAALAFDNSGNLYFTDVLNNRVLRYAAADLSAGINGAAASLVLGQNSFATNDAVTSAFGTNNLPVKDKLGNPQGIAVDSTGRVYVSDATRRVLVYAPNPSANGTPATRVLGLVVAPSATTTDRDNKTQFAAAQGLFLTSDDRLGVVDAGNHRIMLFGPVASWPAETTTLPSPPAVVVIGQAGDFSKKDINNGSQEASASAFSSPVQATLTRNGELFVADAANHRVLVLPQQGASFAAATRVFGQDKFEYNTVNLIEGREFRFVQPLSNGSSLVDAGLVVDQSSSPPHLYVADTYNNRILGFNDVRSVRPGAKADLVIGQPDMYRSVCNYGTNNSATQPDKNTLCRPTGLLLDSGGNLWVADSGNSRVLRFPSPFAQQAFLPSADTVVGQPDFRSQLRAPAQMFSPYGLALDGDSRLLVSDQAYNRVLIFEKNAQGVFQRTKVLGQPDFASIGSGSLLNQMSSPQHIATDSFGRLYVADSGNNRILIFDSTVNLRSGDAALDLSIQSNLNHPNAVYVNAKDEIWVADTSNFRLLRYPTFDTLLFGSSAANYGITEYGATIALTQDQFGNLYVAESSNRIAIHYPNLLAANAAILLTDNRGVPINGLAPGMLASICPPVRDLAIACRPDDPAQFLDDGSPGSSNTDLPNPYPLPTVLADTQVLLNGNPVPLMHVDAQKINFQVPFGTPTHADALLEVVRASTGQTLGSGAVNIKDVSPGLFYCDPANQSVCTPIKTKPITAYPPSVNVYQAVAANADGTVNTESNPAARKTVIQIFGTGQGVLDGAPGDGQVSPDGIALPDGRTQVIINNTLVPADSIKFSGLAPGMVGVWRIDFVIPDLVPPGNAPVFVVLNSVRSSDPTRLVTTIAVKQ